MIFIEHSVRSWATKLCLSTGTLLCLSTCVLLCLSACMTVVDPAATAVLNSERIKARYGNYGVQVLRQTPRWRESCLYSRRHGQATCRTLAIVRFESPVSQELAAPLARIRGGASLGATLSAAGWRVVKINRRIDSYRLAQGSPASGLLRIDAPQEVAIHIYDLHAIHGEATHVESQPVATLLELHHPHYLTEAQLHNYYAQLSSEPLNAAALRAWLDRIDRLPTAPPFN